jgi:hypothetical protein
VSGDETGSTMVEEPLEGGTAKRNVPSKDSIWSKEAKGWSLVTASCGGVRHPGDRWACSSIVKLISRNTEVVVEGVKSLDYER